MYCKYCGKQLDGQAKFCPNCGKGIDSNTFLNKANISIIISAVITILCSYGIFADAIGITEEGELNPLGFVILLLLAGCAVALYKTRVYLFNIICFGALSLIYLIRIINLRDTFTEKYFGDIDFDSFKTIYWVYFIALSVLSIILAIKYLYEGKNEMIVRMINRLKSNGFTGDDMNNIVLMGMHKKRYRFVLITGIVICFAGILANIILIRSYINSEGWHYEYFRIRGLRISRIADFFDMGIIEYHILSILYFVCLGIVMYAIHSNRKNGKPLMQLSRGFNIALGAFIIQFCSSLLYILYDNYDDKIKVVSFIIIAVNLGLCCSLYILCGGFKGKLGSKQLNSFVIFSMLCLGISLAIGIFNIYHVYKEIDISSNDWTAINKVGLIKDAVEVIPAIILLLLLNNMKKNRKALDVNVEELEDKPQAE